MKVLSFFIKENSLIPASEESRKFIFNKIKKSESEIFLTEYRYRILKHHKKFFAIIKKFIENLNKDLSVEDVLIYLKLKCGLYKKINFKKQEVIIPDSISFLEMDQTEFEDFYKKAIRIIADILGVEVKDLENEADY